jgi:GntR family transcriptional repressor for pyruvate dehydrogenase complex
MINRSRREIQRRRVHDDIVEYLLEDIKNGVYNVGSELPSERDLMEEFQVGRSSIRESLLKLERMGILELRPGVRAKICEPSVSPLLNEMANVVRLNLQNPEGQKYFLDARCFFESALARRAATTISEHQLNQLKELIEAKTLILDDVERFAELDMQFHLTIAEASGNPLFVVIFQHLNKWLLEQRLITLANSGQSVNALEAHKRIYDALAAHDPDLAGTMMIEHLTQIQEVYQTLSLGDWCGLGGQDQ